MTPVLDTRDHGPWTRPVNTSSGYGALHESFDCGGDSGGSSILQAEYTVDSRIARRRLLPAVLFLALIPPSNTTTIIHHSPFPSLFHSHSYRSREHIDQTGVHFIAFHVHAGCIDKDFSLTCIWDDKSITTQQHFCTNRQLNKLAATLRWFTAGGAIRVALRQLCKTGNDVIDDVIIWVQDGNCKKWLERILLLVRCTI